MKKKSGKEWFEHITEGLVALRTILNLLLFAVVAFFIIKFLGLALSFAEKVYQKFVW